MVQEKIASTVAYIMKCFFDIEQELTRQMLFSLHNKIIESKDFIHHVLHAVFVK